jgi:glutamate carboxypeptidase
MGELSSTERGIVERAAAEPMLEQVLAWSAVNSGSRNLGGLEGMAELLADAFSALPGVLRLENPAPVEAVDAAGRTLNIAHGRHLHLTVRPTAPVQLLFTGHMDTVFGEDHTFQETRWLEDGVLNGPGVADMKGGIAVMLAALKGVEKSSAAERIGYEVVINSDEEVGSPASAPLLTLAAAGKRAADVRARRTARRNARRSAPRQRQFFLRRSREERPCGPQSGGRAQRDRRGVGAGASARHVQDARTVGQSGEDRRGLSEQRRA